MEIKRRDISHTFESDLPDEAIGRIHLTYDGQVFTYSGIKPDPDGRGVVLEWTTDCVDCGVEFRPVTGLTFDVPKRRCSDCGKEWVRKQYKRK